MSCCLDAYWILSPEGSEVSVETGLRAQAVKRHYYTLGGASNIVANLAAAVTVQKFFQTGTASGAEILAISKDAK